MRRGFPNKASHAPWLGNILNGPLPLAPLTIIVPVHVPSKGVRVPLAIWSTFDYLPHRDIRSFIEDLSVNDVNHGTIIENSFDSNKPLTDPN